MKKRRNQQILKRKNFLPTLLVTILLWGMAGALVYFIDPATFAAIPLFFILIFLIILFTFSLLFAASRRGLIAAIAVTLFLFLSYLGVGNVLNLLLIVAIAVCVELYFGATENESIFKKAAPQNLGSDVSRLKRSKRNRGFFGRFF